MKAPAARAEAGSRGGGGDFLAQLGEGGRGQDGAAAPPPAPGGGLLAPPPQAPPAVVSGALRSGMHAHARGSHCHSGMLIAQNCVHVSLC
jgi:hypothetical protein